MTTKEKEELMFAVREALYTENTRPQEVLAAVASAMAYVLKTTLLDVVCLIKWWATDAFADELDNLKRDAKEG